jgi:hypothetical protein
MLEAMDLLGKELDVELLSKLRRGRLYLRTFCRAMSIQVFHLITAHWPTLTSSPLARLGSSPLLLRTPQPSEWTTPGFVPWQH